MLLDEPPVRFDFVVPGQLPATVHAREDSTAAVRKAIRLGDRTPPLPLISTG